MRDLTLTVTSVRRETPGTRIVRLALGDHHLRYRAGQAALIAPAGAAEQVPYSIASAPHEAEQSGTLEFLIKIDADGSWGDDFAPLRRGQQLALRGPVGSFAFPSRVVEPRLLFIAGGTGIAPLRAMARQAVLTGYRGAIRMLYSARTPADFAYARELRGMARRGEIELLLTATREVAPRWRGKRERIAATLLAPLVTDPRTRCFVCGPAAMVADVPKTLRELGVSPPLIHVEQWQT